MTSFMRFIKNYGFYFLLALTWIMAWVVLPEAVGERGWLGNILPESTLGFVVVYFFAMAHFTIVAMSLSFHRYHTHQAVWFHPVLDTFFQTWLWCVTSMSKLDWVSVHVYHHTYSDTEKDAHSPKQKGFWNVFFFGALDYTRAKNWDEVLKIRKRLPTTRYEAFIAKHLFLGPILLSTALFFLFGAELGSVLMVLNFALSPLFAVGGVNALAHAYGYQNYDSKDESRNIGFLFPLNFIICGELDHNNHHKYPKCPKFSHRSFEFDIGWGYIQVFQALGLARVKGKVQVYAELPDSQLQKL